MASSSSHFASSDLETPQKAYGGSISTSSRGFKEKKRYAMSPSDKSNRQSAAWLENNRNKVEKKTKVLTQNDDVNLSSQDHICPGCDPISSDLANGLPIVATVWACCNAESADSAPR